MEVIDRYNMIVGGIIAILSMFLGKYWYLFAGYLLLNALDFCTGWYRSYKLHQESSKVGFKGILKKLGYWIVIVVAFLFSRMMMEFCSDMFNIQLPFLMLFGWFTLATLIVNETRSILENLVQCNVGVPEFLIRGLAITEKMIKAKAESQMPTEEKQESQNG